MKRTFLITYQVEAETAEDALRLKRRFKLHSIAPSSPHVIEALSQAIGTPLSDPEVGGELGFKPKRR